jgi:NAD(P)-dependent dehydrogenase (short-subunit alcohol dehydrogenase family)
MLLRRELFSPHLYSFLDFGGHCADKSSGVIDTPMVRGAGMQSAPQDLTMQRTPMNRIGQPEEVAEVICWLLCERSSYVTGIVHPVDGGWTA